MSGVAERERREGRNDGASLGAGAKDPASKLSILEPGLSLSLFVLFCAGALALDFCCFTLHLIHTARARIPSENNSYNVQ